MMARWKVVWWAALLADWKVAEKAGSLDAPKAALMAQLMADETVA
jgi:hypothetical protein